MSLGDASHPAETLADALPACLTAIGSGPRPCWLIITDDAGCDATVVVAGSCDTAKSHQRNNPARGAHTLRSPPAGLSLGVCRVSFLDSDVCRSPLRDGRSPPVGMDMLGFLAAGIITFIMFRSTVTHCQASIVGNRPLLYFPQVRPVDIALGRALLAAATLIAVLSACWAPMRC